MIKWDKILEVAIPAALSILPQVLCECTKDDYSHRPMEVYTPAKIENTSADKQHQRMQLPDININIYTSKQAGSINVGEYEYHYKF